MPGCFNCVSPVIPAAHPSFPRSLSPAPTGERESIPPLPRLSREACPRPRSGTGNPSRHSPVSPAKLVPGPDRGAGTHPAAHPSSREACPRPRSGNPSRRSPSFPRSLSPAPTGERESIPPLTRLSREACPRPRPGSGNPSRRSPVIPVKTGIHAFLMLDCHWTSPKRMGKQESSRKLKGPLVLNSRHLALAPSDDHSLRC